MNLSFLEKLISNPKKLVIFLVVLILLIGLISFTIFSSSKKSPMLSPVSETDSNVKEVNSQFDLSKITDPPFPTDKFNILILGKGDPSHPGGYLTDSLIVINIDTVDKNLTFISIPRDTWITLESGSNNKTTKINAAYSIGEKAEKEAGGRKLVKYATSKVVGIPIHYVISIDFSGLQQAIDILDGVVVNVPKTFDDYFYPVRGRELESCGKTPEEIAALTASMSGFQLEKQFECRYEHLHFDAGKNQMDGETVLKYVRSRHSDQHGGDFARAERQQSLILGIKDKLISLQALDDVVPFFEKLNQTVETDIDKNIIQIMAKLLFNINDYQVSKIVLSDANVFNSSTSSNGQFILVPKAGINNWQAIHQYITEQIKEKNSQ
ncbi:LCP family protein [Patescibacteria group bacterium]